MRILLVNPNSSEMITEKIRATAKKYAEKDDVFETITLEKSPACIETPSDELLAGIETVSELKKREGTYDAAVICCFSDPGLAAARQLIKVPVIGICEAAVLLSRLYSYRFSIISSCGPQDISAFMEQVERYGEKSRLDRVYPLGSGVLGVSDQDYPKLDEMITDAKDRGVDAVILGCAAFSGMGVPLSEKHGCFVSDGIGPAIFLAKAMVGLNANFGEVK